MNRSIIFRITVVVLLALYPLIIFFGLKVVPPGFFGLALAVLLLLRFGIIRPEERSTALPAVAILLAYAIACALAGSTKMLLYYPVLVNAILFVLFAGSLREKDPLLLRIVRARGITISEYGPMYLTRLTAVWAGFFVINGIIALWTISQSIEIWTVYNGFIAYVLVAALVVCEFIFRRYFKRRRGITT